MYKTIILLTFLASGNQLMAETSEPLSLGGGLICDSVEQVRKTVASDVLVEGCGYLNKITIGTVTKLNVETIGNYRFQIVRFNFVGYTSFPATQYGIWGHPIPVEAKDTSL